MAKKPENKTAGYIAATPKDIQAQLKKVRTAIKKAAPGAIERTDYFGWPGYSYKGYDYDGMFVWFSYKKPFIRLHVRPPVLQDNAKAVTKYKTTKAVVSFPTDAPVPLALVTKLTKASLKVMKGGAKA